MARLPRLYAPNVAQLVQTNFAHPLNATDGTQQKMQLDQLLHWLELETHALDVALHGWVLLNDRATLLVTPPDQQRVPRLMQALGRRMATGIQHGRVFNGRYRNALIEPGRWILMVLTWLESLPVELSYADTAESWPWSSAAQHAGAMARHQVLSADPLDYWQSGNTPFARQAHHKERLRLGLSAAEVLRIERTLHGQWVLGDAAFIARLESVVARRLSPGHPGRPRKARPDTLSPPRAPLKK